MKVIVEIELHPSIRASDFERHLVNLSQELGTSIERGFDTFGGHLTYTMAPMRYPVMDVNEARMAGAL